MEREQLGSTVAVKAVKASEEKFAFATKSD
jgi:hypothetical protein